MKKIPSLTTNLPPPSSLRQAQGRLSPAARGRKEVGEGVEGAAASVKKTLGVFCGESPSFFLPRQTGENLERGKLRLAALYLILVIVIGAFSFPSPAGAEFMPGVFILDHESLLEARGRIRAGDPALLPAFKTLLRDAERQLGSETFSVTNKKAISPSGDNHDYMSLAPYWWPNPKTPDGLPYVRRDGEVNPERDRISDRKALEQLVHATHTLALAYFFTGLESCAMQASKLLRVWFLDEATRMNPHLRYAQAIAGRNNGRGAGIIETHNLPEVIDAVGLLTGSKSWTAEQQLRLQEWFNAYLAWLLESAQGRDEAKARNNHGSWYDVQIAAFALYAGKNQSARKVLSEIPAKRIARQIEPDGRQPEELQRAQGWSYSIFNLEALFAAASIADKLAIDLGNFATPDGRGMRKALDWLVPFATAEKKWPYPQTSELRPGALAPLLRRAALRYRQSSYEEAIKKISANPPDQRIEFLYPKPAPR